MITSFCNPALVTTNCTSEIICGVDEYAEICISEFETNSKPILLYIAHNGIHISYFNWIWLGIDLEGSWKIGDVYIISFTVPSSGFLSLSCSIAFDTGAPPLKSNVSMVSEQ